MIRARGEAAPDRLTKIELEAVERDGERVAGWLLGQVRGKLDRHGVASFQVGGGQDAPPWFRVGIEWIRRQAGRYVVSVRERGGRREYRVRRLGDRTGGWTMPS